MIILSMYLAHDSSVCILKDEEVLLNLQLERFSRIKYDYGYREDFVKHCLSVTNLSIGDVDMLCAKCDLWEDLDLREGTVFSPQPIPRVKENQQHVEYDLTLFGKKFSAINVEHHMAHAASAFFTSPYDSSAIFTFDGGGDRSNGFIGYGEKNKIVKAHNILLGDVANVAAWWTHLCFHNYMIPKVHELDPGPAGKLMALAAYGSVSESVVQELKQHIEKREGPCFNQNENLSDTRSKRSQDVAACLQRYTELFFKEMLQGLYEKFPVRNLCYSGGLALNCIANSRILPTTCFSDAYIPPCPNDSGIALGMAYYAYYQYFGYERKPCTYFSPYTGIKYSEKEISDAIRRNGYRFSVVTSSEVAQILSEKNIVCFFIGRSECGPRALGHRSIMAHPGIDSLRGYLNENVKMREWYRPFAPIILQEYVGSVFETDIGCSPYMSKSGVVIETLREKVRGILHIDNTTRPQIISKDQDGYVYDILSKFYSKTGIPLLLNTSYNRREPIVETPDDAIRTFTAMPIRYLVMNEFIVTK